MYISIFNQRIKIIMMKPASTDWNMTISFKIIKGITEMGANLPIAFYL